MINRDGLKIARILGSKLTSGLPPENLQHLTPRLHSGREPRIHAMRPPSDRT